MSPTDAPEPLPAAPSPKRVLLLEDDRTTQTLLALGLSEAGYEVELATRVKDAQRALSRQRFDVVVTDGLLPDGTGLAFVRDLRRDGFRGHVFFLSSFFRDLRSFQSLRGELGVEEVMHKPVALPFLVRRITQALDRAAV